MRDFRINQHRNIPNKDLTGKSRGLIIFCSNRERHAVKKVLINNKLYVDYQYHWGGQFYLGDRFSLPEFAQIFEISTRTVHRWLEPDAIPMYALRHLALLTGAVMASAAFEGFYLVEGALYTPAGRKFDPGTLEGIQWKIQETEILKRDLAELREKYDRETHQLRLSADYWREQAGAPMASNDED